MKKIVRLNESDLIRIVKRVIKESIVDEYIEKMNRYEKILELDRYTDRYDVEKGEFEPGEYRYHPGGDKQTYSFLNGIIRGLSKIIDDFKKESDSNDDVSVLEKKAYFIYKNIAKKVSKDDDILSDDESFYKFIEYLNRGYKYG